MELDAHKSAVARAYGLASEGYNKPALRFFSQGAESLVDFAGLSPGQKILDVASGTGHAAFYAGRKVGTKSGSVVGIDIAEEMVKPMHMPIACRRPMCTLNEGMVSTRTLQIMNLTPFFVRTVFSSSRRWSMQSENGSV